MNPALERTGAVHGVPLPRRHRGGVNAASEPDALRRSEHQCFAGCDWDTVDEEAFAAWLRDPNAVKLGSKMPNYHLTQDEIDALVAYLESLT